MGEQALVEELWNVVKASAPLLIDQGGGQADRLRARASEYSSVGELREHIAAVCQAAKPGTPIALMARRCATALADYDTRRAAPAPTPARQPKHRKTRAAEASAPTSPSGAPSSTSTAATSPSTAAPRRTKGVKRSDSAAGSPAPPAKRAHSSSNNSTNSNNSNNGGEGTGRTGSHHRGGGSSSSGSNGGAGAPGSAGAEAAALAAEQFRTVVAQAAACAGREVSWTARRNPLLAPTATPEALQQAQRAAAGVPGPGGASRSSACSRRRDVALLELQDDIAVLEDEVRRLVNARQYVRQGRAAEAHALLARAEAQRRAQRRHAQLFEAHRAALLAAVDASAVHTPQSIYDALEIRFESQLRIHSEHLAAAAAAAKESASGSGANGANGTLQQQQQQQQQIVATAQTQATATATQAM